MIPNGFNLVTRVPERIWSTLACAKGPSIYDVRKIFGILEPPLPPLSAFYATYQYCSSIKSANSLTPLPPSVRTS